MMFDEAGGTVAVFVAVGASVKAVAVTVGVAVKGIVGKVSMAVTVGLAGTDADVLVAVTNIGVGV
jgi:hypothetical protein